MARRYETTQPDQSDEDLKLRGGRLPGMENVEEELNLPEDQRLDYMRKPGDKGYMETKPMAQRRQAVAPLPPEGSDDDARRKLANRLNVNEMMQGREDMKRGGYGTSRDFMPGPPTSEPNVLLNPDDYSQGGRVKHGSTTVVRCRGKHE